jgi:hypothetical protein
MRLAKRFVIPGGGPDTNPDESKLFRIFYFSSAQTRVLPSIAAISPHAVAPSDSCVRK